MNLMQIKCFCAVAECMNFSQAAQLLYITQPAASRLVSSLEKEVGSILLNRDTRHVSLTAAGEVFYHSCRQMIDAYELGISNTKLVEQGIVGKICIGFMRDTFEHGLVNIVQVYRKKYPDVKIEMHGYNHSDLIKGLLDKKIDIAMGGSFDNITSDPIEYIRIRKQTQGVILPCGHPLAAKSSIALNELRNENFIIMSRISSMPGHDYILEITKKAGYIPNIVAYASHVPELLTMVASGLGITIFHTERALRIAGDYCVAVPINFIDPVWRYISWLKGNDNPCLKQLITMIYENMK